MGKIYACSDIHGHFDTWIAALDETNISFEQGDKLMILGDLIDRGPKSKECVQYAFHLMDEYPKQVIYLQGNHENLLLNTVTAALVDAIEGSVDSYNTFSFSAHNWLQNGGVQALDSFITYNAETSSVYTQVKSLVVLYSEMIERLSALPCYHIEGDYAFVHAGFKSNVPLLEQNEEDMIWIRNEFFAEFTAAEGDVLNGKTIIHGHTPVQHFNTNEIYKGIHHIDIDGGAASNRAITIYNVTDDLVHSKSINSEKGVI